MKGRASQTIYLFTFNFFNVARPFHEKQKSPKRLLVFHQISVNITYLYNMFRYHYISYSRVRKKISFYISLTQCSKGQVILYGDVFMDHLGRLRQGGLLMFLLSVSQNGSQMNGSILLQSWRGFHLGIGYYLRLTRLLKK